MELSILFTVIFCSLFFLFTRAWIVRTFGVVDVSATFLTILTGKDNLKQVNAQFRKQFRKKVLEKAILLALAGTLFFAVLTSKNALQMAETAANMLREHIGYTLILPIVAAGLLGSMVFSRFAASHLQLWGMKLTYFDPKLARIAARAPKNLVIIYFESIETGYRNEAIFGENLLASLDARAGVSFDRLRPLPRADYSLAAMVAGMLSLPFHITRTAYRAFRDHSSRPFLPSATGLGDILAAQGYRNIYMCGTSRTIHGIDSFFGSHGFQEVLGREELSMNFQPNILGPWGLYDDQLLDCALVRIGELRESGQRHCVVIGTVDTHSPKGVASHRLRTTGAAPTYPAIVRTSASAIAEFIARLEASGALDDTVVAVIGDHLMPSGEVVADLKKAGERTLYNRFYGVNLPAPMARDITPNDLMATYLECAGFHIEGGRLGLGRSGFSAEAETVILEDKLPPAASWLTKRDYAALWEAPKDEVSV